jgi:hypothetical protein
MKPLFFITALTLLLTVSILPAKANDQFQNPLSLQQIITAKPAQIVKADFRNESPAEKIYATLDQQLYTEGMTYLCLLIK